MTHFANIMRQHTGKSAREWRIGGRLPTLVRLRSNNKAEVIVKVLREHSSDAMHKTYVIEWTPEGVL